MAHHLIMLCSSLTRSHCLFISIHPCLSHIAVIAVVAATLLSPSPLPLPPHKLSPLQPPPLPPPLPPSPLRWLLPLPSPVGCCILGSDLSGFSPWANPDFSKKNTQKSTARQQTTLQSIRLLLTWLQQEGLLGMAAIGGISPDMLERNGVEGGVNKDDDEYEW